MLGAHYGMPTATVRSIDAGVQAEQCNALLNACEQQIAPTLELGFELLRQHILSKKTGYALLPQRDDGVQTILTDVRKTLVQRLERKSQLRSAKLPEAQQPWPA